MLKFSIYFFAVANSFFSMFRIENMKRDYKFKFSRNHKVYFFFENKIWKEYSNSDDLIRIVLSTNFV